MIDSGARGACQPQPPSALPPSQGGIMHDFATSRLIELARQARRVPHIAIVIILTPVFAIAAQLGIIPLVLVLAQRYGIADGGMIRMPDGLSATEAGFWFGMMLIFGFIAIFALLWAWLAWFERRPLHTLGYERRSAAWQYARGMLLGCAMFAAVIALLALTGSVVVEPGDPAQLGTAAVAGVALVLLGWIVQGGAEEALLRGWALPTIAVRHGPWWGLAISSVLFAVLHGLNPDVTPLALANLLLFGVFAGVYALREGSLWGISAIHSAWNWSQGNLFGLAVSGMGAQGGTLVDLGTRAGADWLTGGAFGPEGGLAVTVVLLVAITGTVLRRPVQLPADASRDA